MISRWLEMSILSVLHNCLMLLSILPNISTYAKSCKCLRWAYICCIMGHTNNVCAFVGFRSVFHYFFWKFQPGDESWNTALHPGYQTARFNPRIMYTACAILVVWLPVDCTPHPSLLLGDGLTHWGRVTHICVGKLTIIGSDNGLSPGRRQAIIWTNARLLSIGPLRTYFSENLIKIQQFSLTKIHVKMSSAKCRPTCLGINVLNQPHGCTEPYTTTARHRYNGQKQ